LSKKRLIENALSMGVVQLVSLGLPLLSLPYLAAVLGAEQLGRMAFALSVAQILVMLTDYGFNLSASKAVSVYRHNPEKVAEIWCSVTLVRVLLALVGLACIGISALMFERARNELGLFLIAYIMVLGNILYPQWLFQGLEKLKIISLVQLVARVIVFALIFILVKSSSDIYWATFLQAGGYLFGGILALPLTLNALGPKRLRWPSPYKLIEQLKQGWHLFIFAAAAQ
jgi:PST family polysaccharide transporter